MSYLCHSELIPDDVHVTLSRSCLTVGGDSRETVAWLRLIADRLEEQWDLCEPITNNEPAPAIPAAALCPGDLSGAAALLEEGR